MKNWFQGIFDLLFPEDVSCVLCKSEGDIVTGSGLCQSCYSTLPMDITGERVLSTSCFWAMEYEGIAMDLVHGLKFENKRYMARTLSFIMAKAADALFASTSFDAVCPMPIHPNRMGQRGYNQSDLIAKPIAEHMGLPYYPNLLLRIKDTRPQMELSREERLTNVKGAFAVSEEAAALKGKTLLLVDDVLTTGASTSACHSVLKENGIAMAAFCAARRYDKS
ncbi:MAG: ComF family protein [Clostridiales bacterium]|nr:ComF family protein [Clostridiales bacterium]